MPETTIYEYCHPVPPKNEVRFPEHRQVAAPAVDVVLAQQTGQHLFCVFVPVSANPRHHLRPFGLGKDV